MAKSCCEAKSCELDILRERQSRVLWIALAINLIMFLVELSAGILAHSTALLADSLDMLGDALIYGFSLFAVTRSPRWGAGASLLKGSIMLLFGLGVLAEALYKSFQPIVPSAQIMGVIGLLALMANSAVLLLLWRHRADNLNMRSTWLCSRNDIIANLGVLLAAAAVSLTLSRWPDIVVGMVIAALFLHSAADVLRQSMKELRT